MEDSIRNKGKEVDSYFLVKESNDKYYSSSLAGLIESGFDVINKLLRK